MAAWSNSRARTAGDDTEPGFASPSRLSFVRLLSSSTPTTTTTFTTSLPGSVDVLSPTSLSRKSDRRRSSPIPRTYPYGAPYFASPPVLLDKNDYPSYLKALPRFEDETQFSSARTSERGREPAIRRVPLNPRVVQKRRSASEDWTVRPPINSCNPTILWWSCNLFKFVSGPPIRCSANPNVFFFTRFAWHINYFPGIKSDVINSQCTCTVILPIISYLSSYNRCWNH